MDPFVSEDNVSRYLQQTKSLSNLTQAQVNDLAVMVNYFTQGVVTELENFLYEHIKEQKQTLQFGVSDTCIYYAILYTMKLNDRDNGFTE